MLLVRTIRRYLNLCKNIVLTFLINYYHYYYHYHAIDWESAKLVNISNDHYRRLVVEYSLIKRVANFNSMQSTVLIDDGTSELIFKSEPRILRIVG